jgi:tagatose-1,6-bisphosphate aldolase
VLLPYRIDDPGPAAHQEALVITAAAACHRLGMPLVIEPVAYQRPTETVEAYAAAYPGLMLRAVERLQPLGADLLKLPFPVLDSTATAESAVLDACRAVGEACRETPWVLLGAGAGTDVFVEQVRLAGTAGASGFLAGRGIWAAALDGDEGETERIATTICRPDLQRCRDAAERFARPLAQVLVN